jgi:hypothetical protein
MDIFSMKSIEIIRVSKLNCETFLTFIFSMKSIEIIRVRKLISERK